MSNFGGEPRSKMESDDVLTRMRPRAERVLKRYSIPAKDAEDLLQETMIATLAKWDKINDIESWFLVTLRNRCVMYWRRRRNEIYDAVDQSILELLDEPLPSGDREQIKLDLQSILEELPPRCRQLLKLRYGLGYDTAEVAEAMGYHASSIRKVARRCMAALTHLMVTKGFSKDS